MLLQNTVSKLHPIIKISLTAPCRRALFQTKPLNYNNSVIRTFRLYPSNGSSIRGRFGKSRRPNEYDSISPALDVGKLAIAAGAAVGIGSICYYGLSMAPSAKGMSAFEQAPVWPEYIRQRIRATYGYFAGSAAIAAGTALALVRSPRFCQAMYRYPIAAPIGFMLMSVGSSILCQSMPYPASGGLSVKHLAWTLFSSSIGAMLVPACMLGGPILTRAAIYTGGIVGGLSLVACSAPSDKFLMWGGPLSIGLGVVFVASLGSMFLSPVSRLGSGLYAVSLYGGLVLFSGFLLYDTQLVIDRAVKHPRIDNGFAGGLTYPHTIRPFDPINNSIHIFMDTVNIFIRVVAILAGGGGGQRRK